MHNDVQMIAHHCERPHRDREHLGQLDQPIFQPLLAVIKVAAGERIVTTQKRAPHAARHAARHAVVGAGGIGSDE